MKFLSQLRALFSTTEKYAMETPNPQEKYSDRPAKVTRMIEKIDAIIEEAKAQEEQLADTLARVHDNYLPSARNLLHYRAFRQHDLRKLQKALGNLGLSRLAKSQSHVMASLETNRAILQALKEETSIQFERTGLSVKKSRKRLRSNAKNLLGYRTKSRRTRIMVTMPSEAAEDFQLVYRMLESGMNCARINCAHDDALVWKKIIDNVRLASEQLDKHCKIAMDLAGPKIRTGAVEEGPKVRKIRPPKDIRGAINEPLEIWIGESPNGNLPHVPLAAEDLEQLEGTETLYFRDARHKKRTFQLIKKEGEGFLAHCLRTTYIETGMSVFTNKKRTEQPMLIGDIPPLEMPLLLKKGDTLRLDKDTVLGASAKYDEVGNLIDIAHISCTNSEIFEQVQPGERILFDDGKIKGIIETVTDDHLLIDIIRAAENGAKLRADKGINLPDSELTISGLTPKDREDLAFIAQHADVVNFSFVNRPEDVSELVDELEKLDALDRLGIILKIETQSGFNKLTEILLTAMQVYPVGVMIARGDLAIEAGWNNIGRVQEEILSLCQAAHITDIWATQVLEGLAKRGIPSRAEITDAVMAQRADCVMLNKGPFILEAITLLDTILAEMEPYWEKNAPLSPMLSQANKKM